MQELFAGRMRTPLLHLRHSAADLYCKLEHCGPTGSSKDRSALWSLKVAVEAGLVTRGTTVVESSSGNFALALAYCTRQLGVPFVPVLDPNTNRATLRQLQMVCERVEVVHDRDTSGGFLETRLRRVQQLRRELPNSYWPNQYANPTIAEAHYKLTGTELCEDLHELDAVFVAVSSAGTVAGVSRRVKEQFPRARVVAVDSAGSVIFGGPAAPRRLPGLGSSVVPALVRQALIDEVRIVPEADAVAGCHRLLSDFGLFAGGSSGSLLVAVEQYLAEHSELDHPSIAFISPDRGLPYIDTIYDPAWVAATYPDAVVPAALGAST